MMMNFLFHYDKKAFPSVKGEHMVVHTMGYAAGSNAKHRRQETFAVACFQNKRDADEDAADRTKRAKALGISARYVVRARSDGEAAEEKKPFGSPTPQDN